MTLPLLSCSVFLIFSFFWFRQSFGEVCQEDFNVFQVNEDYLPWEYHCDYALCCFLRKIQFCYKDCINIPVFWVLQELIFLHTGFYADFCF